MWSLGCVLLEIVSGIPLWMSLKTLVHRKGCDMIKYGLFAVKGRLFDKIIKKQIEVANNLDHYLNEEVQHSIIQNYSGITLELDLKQALRRMLSVDPSQRISPSELIKLLTINSSKTAYNI
jgi:dual specificity tyrosine-phosphorylation-regulated kinase 2/3/4